MENIQSKLWFSCSFVPLFGSKIFKKCCCKWQVVFCNIKFCQIGSYLTINNKIINRLITIFMINMLIYNTKTNYFPIYNFFKNSNLFSLYSVSSSRLWMGRWKNNGFVRKRLTHKKYTYLLVLCRIRQKPRRIRLAKTYWHNLVRSFTLQRCLQFIRKWIFRS
jgi:hypothetical protein